MGRSCCERTPSQADAIDKAELKKSNSSSNCCGSSSETSSQEKSYRNGAIRKNDKTDDNNANATSAAQRDDPVYKDPIDPCKGAALPGACEDGCCDQSASAAGKNIRRLDAFSANVACCAGNFTAKSKILSSSVSSGHPHTHTGSGTPWSSEHATSVEPIVAECCQDKPSPCCDEACLDRLALRECHTGSDIPCMEAAGYCMLNINGLCHSTLLILGLMQLFPRHPHRQKVQRFRAELAIDTIAQLESSMLLGLQHWGVSAVLFLPLARNHAASLESALRWVRVGALNGH